MRRLWKTAALTLVLAAFAITAATVQALPPHGFSRISSSEFQPVTLVALDPSARDAAEAVAVLATPLPPFPIYESIALLSIPQPRASTRPPAAAPKSELKTVSGVVTSAGGGTKGRLSGNASWYCKAGRSICPTKYPDTGGFDAYAAAGPALRIAMGGGASTSANDPWRGRTVTVCGNGECIPVRLVDWCQCFWKQSNEKVIDLFKDVFDIVGGRVTVSW